MDNGQIANRKSNKHMLLGIDGGGSKTMALLANQEGLVIGRGYAGASNYQAVGAAAAFAELKHAADVACAGAGRDIVAPAAVCLGLAGAGRPGDKALIRTWAAQQWPNAAITVVSDAELVLAVGTPQGWGAALICGTGSIAIGRDQVGNTARAGGWGYLFGDEGSGYAIGSAALRAVACAADKRGPATELTGTLLSHWSLRTPAELIARVYGEKPTNREIADLALLVVQAAAAGDEVSKGIIAQAGDQLAQTIAAVIYQLKLLPPVPCALAGGLITNAPNVARQITIAAEHRSLALAPVTLVDEPARGAIIFAKQMLDRRDR